ncbi:MAG: DUF1540 domain-containing protein [Clostridia bacterium]|nr:DUF1540 domain-containing protein [Clostridia bacterium]
MDDFKKNIKCHVHDCLYWQNDYCSAGKIEVIVGDGSQLAGDEQNTVCKTFVNQRSE